METVLDIIRHRFLFLFNSNDVGHGHLYAVSEVLVSKNFEELVVFFAHLGFYIICSYAFLFQAAHYLLEFIHFCRIAYSFVFRYICLACCVFYSII